MTVASGGRPSPAGDSSPLDTWSETDLVRRVCLGLEIATRAITILGADGFRDEEEPQGSFGPDKVAAETAMLLYVASSVRHHPQISEGIDRVAALLAPGVRSERTRIAIALNPAICLQLAMPHVLLSQLDGGDPQLDRLIDLSVQSPAHRGNEVVPHRELERLWIDSVRTGTAVEESFESTASTSVLRHPLDLVWGSREDAYAHTHALMYFTAFGYARRTLARPRSEILGESAALVARGLLLEDYDLTAEVLMAWPMTGAPWGPAGVFGLRVLAELEDDVGFLPAKNGTPEKFHRLTGPERTRYAVAASYHTAYVMAMVCAMSLRTDRTPPAVVPGEVRGAEIVGALLDAIPPAKTPWRRTFDRLPRVEQQRLAPFLLDVALLARARNNEYSAVARLLALAVEHDLADAPMCAQSAQLLQRVAASAEAAGLD